MTCCCMSKQNCVVLVAALALMASGAGLLNHLHAHQKLGAPGVRTSAIPGSIRLQVELPPRVLDYDSTPLEPDKVTLGVLPQDTSFGQRRYVAPDRFKLTM